MGNQMTDLEQRLTRVSVAAQTASGYANRAEAIMVAFAARRAIDAGEPLDYLEDQLRLLFGNAQPKAVLTIINAARDPVTTNKLRAGLEDVNVLEKGDPKESWWSATMRTMGSLVVVRRAGTPAARPGAAPGAGAARRRSRADRRCDQGNGRAAVPADGRAVARPGTALQRAHRALDVIEAAAILEPRTTAVAPPPSGQAATPAAAAASAPAPAPAPAAPPAGAPKPWPIEVREGDAMTDRSTARLARQSRRTSSRARQRRNPFGRHRHEGSAGMGARSAARCVRSRSRLRTGRPAHRNPRPAGPGCVRDRCGARPGRGVPTQPARRAGLPARRSRTPLLRPHLRRRPRLGPDVPGCRRPSRSG